MSLTFYIIILLIGSFTLTKKIGALSKSIKAKNKGKIKADILFLFLSVALIVVLIILERSTMRG